MGSIDHVHNHHTTLKITSATPTCRKVSSREWSQIILSTHWPGCHGIMEGEAVKGLDDGIVEFARYCYQIVVFRSANEHRIYW